jgi:hypothetical protein
MCFNFRTSIIAYTIGLVSAVFALCTRQLVLGCLVLAYAQMQLSEALIWAGIDKDDPGLNRTGTSFGKYLLATHNLAIGVGIILSVLFISKRKLTFFDTIPMLIGALFFVCIVLLYYLPREYPDMTFPRVQTCKRECQNAENRLQWTFPHKWYIGGFVISILIMIIWVKPLPTKIFMGFAFILTFILAFTIYPNSMGSIWCFSTSFIAPVIVVGNYLIIRNKTSSDILT